MPLPQEFVDFHSSWTAKATSYTDSTARSCFDHFLTQYVIYNRLYCEATLRLSRNADSGIALLGKASFPDSSAAKSYVAQFLGAGNLIESLESNDVCLNAIAELKRILVDRQFIVNLHPVTGAWQEGEDDKLLVLLNSTSRAKRADAILKYIYCIRCNMMHGQKGFSESQVVLLKPIIAILEKICSLLYCKLNITDA